MDAYREVSIIVGILIILSLIVGVLSVSRAVDDSEYLTKSARKSNQIYSAAGFQFLMAVFYVAVAILLFPILKIHHETLAIGFLSFRMSAGLFVLIGTIVLLRILKLSLEYVKKPPSDPAQYLRRGNSLKTTRDLVNHVAMIIMLCLGNILLFTILLQSGLLPGWISIWGLVASSSAIIASMLVLLKNVEVLTPTYVLLNIPLAIQEIVFALWLIVKGLEQI